MNARNLENPNPYNTRGSAKKPSSSSISNVTSTSEFGHVYMSVDPRAYAEETEDNNMDNSVIEPSSMVDDDAMEQIQQGDGEGEDTSELFEYEGQIPFYERFNKVGRLHLSRENYSYYFDSASKQNPGWEYWRCCCKYCRARIVVNCQPYKLENDDRPFRLGYFKNDQHNHLPGQYPQSVKNNRQSATQSYSNENRGLGTQQQRKRTINSVPVYTVQKQDLVLRPTLDELKEAVDGVIADYPDFPKKGILFKDIMPIFMRPELFSALCNAIADKYRGLVDAIAAVEARGFLFGPTVAIDLQVPFVPIRKKGKLPGPTISENYEKEYGTDIFEVQSTLNIQHLKNILLIDDLLATGGSLSAAIKLINKSGGVVSDIFVVIELGGLDGRKVLTVPQIAADDGEAAEKPIIPRITSLLKY